MIRLAISQAAFDAIANTLPLGSVGYNEKGERLIWIATASPTSSPPCAVPAKATATSSCGSSRSTSKGRP
jgi:hypothetical protein